MQAHLGDTVIPDHCNKVSIVKVINKCMNEWINKQRGLWQKAIIPLNKMWYVSLFAITELSLNY